MRSARAAEAVAELGSLGFAPRIVNVTLIVFISLTLAACSRHSMSIHDILAISDDTKFAISLGDAMFKRETEVGFDRLTGAERVALCVNALEREINNGGFDQFFFNSSGDHARQTLEALNAIGAPQVASMLSRAIAVFPDSAPSSDRTKRQAQLDALDQAKRDSLGDVDQEFFAYPEPITELLRVYVESHASEFHL